MPPTPHDGLLVPIDADLFEIIVETINPYHYEVITEHRCIRCKAHEKALGANRCADGRIQVKTYCGACGCELTGPLKLRKGMAEKFPIIRENNHRPCSVRGCTSAYSQMHHVMPTSIDSELSETYPMIDLCVYHHTLWHHVTRIATGS
jgi:hypothetical protein